MGDDGLSESEAESPVWVVWYGEGTTHTDTHNYIYFNYIILLSIIIDKLLLHL